MLDRFKGTGKLSAADIEDQIRRYLRKRLVMTQAGRAVQLRWIGKEVTARWVWVYFEAPLPDGLSGLRIRNEILFDVLADQVNTINFHNGKRRETLTFSRKRPVRSYPANKR